MTAEFTSAFFKDLDKLQSKSVKTMSTKIIFEVEGDKHLKEIKKVKKLKGHKNAYRIRSGDYRIGIFADVSKVEFARMLHRKDIYRLFP